MNPVSAGQQAESESCVVPKPIWEMSAQEFSEFSVTPESKAKDPIWRFIPTTPGMSKARCQINWGIELLDGSHLTDPRHVQRLEWAKKLMALMLHAPEKGDVPAPATLSVFQQGFRWLLSWMAAKGMQTPDHLDSEAYLDDLPRLIVENSDDDEITIAQATRPLLILPWLWSERRLLQKWGVGTVRDNAFRYHGIDHYARAIATKSLGWIPPLPDEVAIPLFNELDWWLGEPAEDVVRLLEVVNDSLAGQPVEFATKLSKKGWATRTAGVKKNARLDRASRFFQTFTFGTLPGETAPWHLPLPEYSAANPEQVPFERLRVLFDAVREACALCVQGMCGLRISELLGIEAGYDSETGLPKGVRIEESATGLYRVYVIRTVLAKTEQGLPREMDWVLGLIPRGSEAEPLPVRALRLLNELHAPWRAKAKTTRLILSGNHGDRLARPSTELNAMSADPMRAAMKRFIARWVDLSGLSNQSKHRVKDDDLVEWRESKGAIFKSHMLRKSWAQFMFAVDPKLLPAIQMQFHHLSIAMSDTGYIGSNPLLVGDMDSVATQARNLMILEMVLGRNPLAGRMGEQLEAATRELAKNVEGLAITDAYAAVVDFCEHTQLPIFFSPHGACMPVSTHEMRCHDQSCTSPMLRTQPNPLTRQPSLCVGCNCFILDARHSEFWAARYMDNWIAYKRAERSGDVAGYKVIKERAVQARKLLTKLGSDIMILDKKIQLILDSEAGRV
jgi:hypothetical protein